MTELNKAELRRLAENAEGSFGQFDPSESEQEFMARITPTAVLSLLDQLDAKENTLMAITTRHFAESWSRRATDAKLDEYLSSGIAQLQAERDAALAELEACRKDAEMYRHLRDGSGWPAVFDSSDDPEPLRGDDLDAAISREQSK